MSIHSRPIRAPKTPAEVASNTITARLVQPEPQPEPLQSGTRPSENDPIAEPSRAPESRAEPAVSDTSRPWYRSEPWMAVALAAFAPLVAAVIAPDTAQYYLIGLSGVLLAVSIVMLLRQGVFRPHAGSGSHRE